MLRTLSSRLAARWSVIRGVVIDGEKVVTYEEAILQEKLPKVCCDYWCRCDRSGIRDRVERLR